jgi:hypothetical protein
MSNTRYTDATNATDPPGGKHHDTTKKDAADRLPPEDGKEDDGPDRTASNRKTAASPKTVAKAEK